LKELTIRVIVAIVGIPIIVFAVLRGELYFFSLIVLISVLGQWELYHLQELKEAIPQRIPGILLGIILLYSIGFGLTSWALISVAALLLIIFSKEMFLNQGSANLNISATLFPVFYPTLFLSALLYLRMHVGVILPQTKANPEGIFILAILVSVWGCDTFAYFFGKQFGKHRLFERVSPKKSMEGAVAGLFGAVLVFFLTRWVGLLDIPTDLAIVSGLIVGIFGQMGDLVESWFKRDAGVKDSSNLLPGHGGILDRFDSTTFIAPAFLILFLLWR